MKKLIATTALSLLLAGPGSAEKWEQVKDDGGYRNPSVRIANLSEPQSADRVVKTAKQFLGLPYVWAGTSPVQGFDCSGYVYEVFRLNGYSIPRMADIQFYETERVSREDLSQGDLVFFTTYLEGPSHVGIYLGDGEFIHASSAGEGVVVSNLDSGYYQERFLGGGRPDGWNPGPTLAQSQESQSESTGYQDEAAEAIAQITDVDEDDVDLEEPLVDQASRDPFDPRRLKRSEVVDGAYVVTAHPEVSSDEEAAALDATQTAGEIASLTLTPVRGMAGRFVAKVNSVISDWMSF